MRTRSILRPAAVLVFALAAAAGADAAPRGPGWVGLWRSAWSGMPASAGFDPEHVSAVAAVDRASGDAYLSTWGLGVWKSVDGGATFARVDGGVIGGGGCGPITAHALVIGDDGRGIATFDMNNSPGASGYSLDGGATWTAFEPVERNWDFGAIDFSAGLVLAARHEDDGLHLSGDRGRSWKRLAAHRDGVTGLGICGRALLVARKDLTERSEDGGETWTVVSAFQGVGAPVAIGGRLWWLAGNRNGLVASGDDGRTWSAVGEPVPAPATQALFGADERHVVALTAAGLYESTDGANTWHLAVALPEGRFWNAGFDPVHDVFYLTGFDQQVLRYARSRPAEYAAPAVPPLAAADGAERPVLRFVADVRPKVRVLATRTIDLVDGFLYQCGEDGLLSFRRDPDSGGLTAIEQIEEPRSLGFMMRCARNRMYGVTQHDGYRRAKWHGLAWFDLDPRSGRPQRRGVVDCPGGDQLLIGPGGTDLYVKTRGDGAARVLWFRLDATGAPALAGEVAGRGIGASSHHDFAGVLRLSPDGQHLYSISAREYAIACIDRLADGSLVYREAVDLGDVAPRDPADDPYRWVSLDLSPDGSWLYAGIRNGDPRANRLAIYRRDRATGALTLAERSTGEQDAIANAKGWSLVFSPSGRGGYLGQAGPLLSFRYDPATGRLSEPRAAAETLGKDTANLAYDAEHGFLYVASQEWEYERFCVFAADARGGRR